MELKNKYFNPNNFPVNSAKTFITQKCNKWNWCSGYLQKF